MTLNIVVCGAGAFGRNHIRIYRELAASGASVHLAAIVDPDALQVASALALASAAKVNATTSLRDTALYPEREITPNEAGQTPDVLKDSRLPPTSQGNFSSNQAPPRIFLSIQALLAAIARGELHVDAASVAVPTSAHHDVAAQLLAAGIHVLVEKPIASTLSEADNLIALAKQNQRLLMVGHLERFNPAVQALAPLLRGPMFFEAHRLSIFSPRSLDVDVVLDLMIHDLDIVLTLARSTVTQVHAVGLPILSQKTDIANVRVEFASGCVANFTASRVSTERVRKLRFFQPHQYISVDYARQDLLVIEVTPTATTSVANKVALSYTTTETGDPGLAPETWKSQKPTPENPPALPTLGMQKPQVTPGEPLRLEIQSFLHAIRTNTPPEVTGEQARNALALALQIQQAIEQHATHAGLRAFTIP